MTTFHDTTILSPRQQYEIAFRAARMEARGQSYLDVLLASCRVTMGTAPLHIKDAAGIVWVHPNPRFDGTYRGLCNINPCIHELAAAHVSAAKWVARPNKMQARRAELARIQAQTVIREGMVEGAVYALEHAHGGRNPHYSRWAIESALLSEPYWRLATEAERSAAWGVFNDAKLQAQVARKAG